MDKTNEINSMDEENENVNDFHVILSLDEKVKCLEEILNKVKKILYVYDKSLEPDSMYNYKVYINGIMLYVSSSNTLFEGELVSVIVNLNAIATNDFNKSQLKRLVFETRNTLEFMLDSYKDEQFKTNEALKESKD